MYHLGDWRTQAILARFDLRRRWIVAIKVLERSWCWWTVIWRVLRSGRIIGSGSKSLQRWRSISNPTIEREARSFRWA